MKVLTTDECVSIIETQIKGRWEKKYSIEYASKGISIYYVGIPWTGAATWFDLAYGIWRAEDIEGRICTKNACIRAVKRLTKEIFPKQN